VPYLSTLADALRYVDAQTGTLSASTRPTTTEATVLWGEAETEVKAALLAAGLSTSVTSGSFAEDFVQGMEALYTGVLVLLWRGTDRAGATGTGFMRLVTEAGGGTTRSDTAAGALHALFKARAAKLLDDKFRAALLSAGASRASTTLPTDMASHAVDYRDTSISDSPPPGGDWPYAEPQPYFDGDSL